MMRVISSPSRSTTGLATLIFAMRGRGSGRTLRFGPYSLRRRGRKGWRAATPKRPSADAAGGQAAEVGEEGGAIPLRRRRAGQEGRDAIAAAVGQGEYPHVVIGGVEALGRARSPHL